MKDYIEFKEVLEDGTEKTIKFTIDVTFDEFMENVKDFAYACGYHTNTIENYFKTLDED